MKNKILIHICLLTMILVTSSCTLQRTAKDPLTILAKKTCEPPCWQGITPGITTLDEAKILIQKIIFYPKRPGILTPTNIYKDGITRTDVYFTEPQIEVNVIADELGIVDRIVFGFASDNRPKLGDCIDLFGDPQFIGLSIIRGFQFTENRFQVVYPNIVLSFFSDMQFQPKSVKIPYFSYARIKTIIFFSEQIKQPDYDYVLPWN